jgi:predicted transcriptional regulator
MSKQEVLNLINNLPDDVSFDEVLYQLYLMSNVNEGISDIQDGRIFTQDEVIGMFR